MTTQEFEHIATKLEPKLLSLIRKFSKNSGMALDEEDIVQETLIVLWELSEKRYPINNSEALCVKICKNICVNRFRTHRISFQTIEGHDCEGGETANHYIEEKDNASILKIIQEGLSKTELRYVKMRNEEDMSLDEIAKASGKPKSSIKVALSIARKKMTAKIKDLGL